MCIINEKSDVIFDYALTKFKYERVLFFYLGSMY
jgi:hypothetical protein